MVTDIIVSDGYRVENDCSSLESRVRFAGVDNTDATNVSQVRVERLRLFQRHCEVFMFHALTLSDYDVFASGSRFVNVDKSRNAMASERGKSWDVRPIRPHGLHGRGTGVRVVKHAARLIHFNFPTLHVASPSLHVVPAPLRVVSVPLREEKCLLRVVKCPLHEASLPLRAVKTSLHQETRSRREASRFLHEVGVPFHGTNRP